MHKVSHGLTILRLLLVVSIVGTVVGLLLPAPVPTHHPPEILLCANNLERIARAIQDYARVHGRLPESSVLNESGTPMHSWRVLVLPHLGESELYDLYDFDRPWNSPQNAALAEAISEAFQCPSCEFAEPTSSHTNYLAVAGVGTFWGEQLSANARSLAEVVLVIETAKCDVNVLEPKDIEIQDYLLPASEPSIAIVSSNHPQGANVVYADGHVKYLSEPIHQAALIRSASRRPLQLDR